MLHQLLSSLARAATPAGAGMAQGCGEQKALATLYQMPHGLPARLFGYFERPRPCSSQRWLAAAQDETFDEVAVDARVLRQLRVKAGDEDAAALHSDGDALGDL